MRKLFTICFGLVFLINLSAQVGINTENPKATLQIQKKNDLTYPDGLILPRISGDSLRMKDAAYGLDQHGAMVFVTSPTTNNSLQTLNVLAPGMYVFDGSFTHANSTQGMWMPMGDGTSSSTSSNDVYAAKAAGSLTLLNVGLNILGSAVYNLPIVNTSNPEFTVDIPSSQIANNSYVVPTDGIYDINYSYRTGQGIRAELLSGNRPGIIITKTVNTTNPTTSTTTALDFRMFGSIELVDLGMLGLINVSLTQGQISHIYKLEAGDIIKFGILQGGLNLGVLEDSSAEISIYKIR